MISTVWIILVIAGFVLSIVVILFGLFSLLPERRAVEVETKGGWLGKALGKIKVKGPIGLFVLGIGVVLLVITIRQIPSSSRAPTATSQPPESTVKGLNLDQYCGSLGFDPQAWLPGQRGVDNLNGRVVSGPHAAYTWSCTRNGPKLTHAELNDACHMQWPGTKEAYTPNPNNAYDWRCVP
jgi:hypothetical protein